MVNGNQCPDGSTMPQPMQEQHHWNQDLDQVRVQFNLDCS